VDLAAPQVEVNAFQRDHAWKSLGNIGEFEKEIAGVAGRGGGPPPRDSLVLTVCTAVRYVNDGSSTALVTVPSRNRLP
jgi:hypothetical protein